jgi:hypothetical protein
MSAADTIDINEQRRRLVVRALAALEIWARRQVEAGMRLEEDTRRLWSEAFTSLATSLGEVGDELARTRDASSQTRDARHRLETMVALYRVSAVGAEASGLRLNAAIYRVVGRELAEIVRALEGDPRRLREALSRLEQAR